MGILFSALIPTRKKAAGTFSLLRISRICGVYTGSGPSSKVSTSFFLSLVPYFLATHLDGRLIISFFRNQQFSCIQFRSNFSAGRTTDYIQHFAFTGIGRCFICDSLFLRWRINENQNCADCPCSYHDHKNPTCGNLHYPDAREQLRQDPILLQNAWN